MSGLQPQKFSQLVDVTDYVANGSFSSLRENVQTSSEPDFAILVRLVDYNNGWSGPFSYVDESSYHFLRKTKLEPGDVVISNVGANAGTVFRVPELSQPLTLGPNSVLCRPRNKEKLNRAFLYYFLASSIGQALLSGIISGSARARPPESRHRGFHQEADFRIAGSRSSNTAGARYVHQECRRTVL